MLTAVEVKNLVKQERAYKKADSAGLYLIVTTSGSKLWRYDYRFGGKRKTLAFGAYPDVGLAAARERRDLAKADLRASRDPATRVGQRVSQPLVDPFESVARAWFKARSGGWVSSYSTKIMSRLEGDIFPVIGQRPIRDIEPPELLAAIRTIEDRGAIELAKRVKNYCGEIFRFGIAEGKCARDPSADIRSALKTPLAKKRRAWLRPAEMPAFMQQLADYHGDILTRLALQFTVLTFVRTNEVRFAQWSEFEDLDGPAPLWRISGPRMKMKNEHLVPLSKQTCDLLGEIRKHSKGPWLFGSAETHDGVMSTNTMIFAMYRMGYRSRATVHGFRSTFSTMANESGLWNGDAIERQLAHVEQNEVRASYNSAEYLPERRRMMQWWADAVMPRDDFDALLA